MSALDWVSDLLCQITQSEYLRTLLSFALGLLGAYGVQWEIDRRRNQRIRQGMRAALVEEVVHNLLVLDAYDKTFTAGTGDAAHDPIRWPDATLNLASLQPCLDPSLNTLLTVGEQMKVPLVFTQLTELRDKMVETHEDMRRYPASRGPLYRYLLVEHLPVVAQNLVDFLCQLLAEQERFASTRVEKIRRKLVAVTTKNPESHRIWRTSDLPRAASPPVGQLIAWRNNAPDLVPADVTVTELRQEDASYGTTNWLAKSRTRWRWPRGRKRE